MSTAFKEYAYIRCDEILESDNDYQKSNLEVYNILEKLKRTFTPEQLVIFARYESELYNQQSNAMLKIYIQGLNDRISLII